MKKMTETLRLLALSLGVSLTLSLAGCDAKTQENLKEQAAEAQKKAGEVAGDAVAQSKAAWEKLKTEYSPQIDELNSKVASLKTEAAKFKDTQLDGYISDLDGKLGEAKAKLSEAFSADGMTALKDNMGKWMGEAKGLYDKAAARIAELAKGAAGSAVGATGG